MVEKSKITRRAAVVGTLTWPLMLSSSDKDAFPMLDDWEYIGKRTLVHPQTREEAPKALKHLQDSGAVRFDPDTGNLSIIEANAQFKYDKKVLKYINVNDQGFTLNASAISKFKHALLMYTSHMGDSPIDVLTFQYNMSYNPQAALHIERRKLSNAKIQWDISSLGDTF